jgi:hypothetical protein
MEVDIMTRMWRIREMVKASDGSYTIDPLEGGDLHV